MPFTRQHNIRKRSRTVYYERIQNKARILPNQTKDETSIRIYKKFAIVSMSVDLVTPPLIDDVIEIIMRCRIESTFKEILEGEFIQEDGLYRACSFALKRFPIIFWSAFEKKKKSLTTMSHSEFLMRVFRNKAFKTLLCKEAGGQNKERAHQIAKTMAKELLDPKIMYIMNPRDLIRPFLSVNAFTKILHAKLQILYEREVTFRANFIELLRHWLDVDEFIDNLYDPDFMKRTSANDIIVSHILSGNHMPFLYGWLAARGPYNTDDDMIRHLKIHLETFNWSIRKYRIFALAFDKQTARDAANTLTTLTFHKSYSLFKKYLTDLEEEIILGNDWTAGDNIDNIREIKCLENYTYLFRNDEAKSTALESFMCNCHQAPINNTARIACEVSISTLVELLFETSNSPQK